MKSRKNTTAIWLCPMPPVTRKLLIGRSSITSLSLWLSYLSDSDDVDLFGLVSILRLSTPCNGLPALYIYIYISFLINPFLYIERRYMRCKNFPHSKRIDGHFWTSPSVPIICKSKKDNSFKIIQSSLNFTNFFFSFGTHFLG